MVGKDKHQSRMNILAAMDKAKSPSTMEVNKLK